MLKMLQIHGNVVMCEEEAPHDMTKKKVAVETCNISSISSFKKQKTFSAVFL